MDTSKLRKDAEAKFQRAKNEFDEVMDYIEEIERLASINGDAPTPNETPKSTGFRGSRIKVKPGKLHRVRPWCGLRHAIRQLAKERPDGFTLRDVEEYIPRTYLGKHPPIRTAISSSLSKMAKMTGELRIVREGFGATPATYAAKRTQDTDAKEETAEIK